MTTVDEHAAHVRQLLALNPGVESVQLQAALGRVTAQSVLSPVDLPLFRNSQMDGFAVRAADVADAPVRLVVSGEVSAQPSNPAELAPGTAVRIMTGAVVPPGADAVVPVEDTSPAGGAVLIRRSRTAGEYVRDRGSDLRAGDELLAAGIRLASRHLAAVAAAGVTALPVRALVRVAVITTGSELVQPGDTPVLGQVFDSNATALDAAVRAAGGIVAWRGHVADDTLAMTAALSQAATVADVILTSGGISMGDYEVVRETLEPLGATVGHVAMQPGGPQATARFAGVPVVCFPGNPVSTQLSFEVFVAPLLREAAGLPAAVTSRRPLTVDVNSVAGKRQFLRGREVDGGVALVGGSSSHLVAGLAASDLLVIVPDDVTALKAGDDVETLAL